MHSQKTIARPKDSGIPFIKAKAQHMGSGVAIPDCMRLQPDAEALKYEAMRKDLLDKLKPDESTLKTVRG